MLFEDECFKASRWTKGNRVFPAVIRVSPEGVTRYKPSLFGQDEITITTAKIASVHVHSGPMFANILIESTGGTDPFQTTGHFKKDAHRIKELIEYAQAHMGQGGHVVEDPSDTKTCPYCAEAIKAAAIVCRYCGKDLAA